MTNILLLEPDEILGKTYSQALKNMGYRVMWRKDSQSAIQSADTAVPAIVITELQLAAHNGVEFLYELRSYNDWQNIPVIIVSHVPSNATSHTIWEHLNIVAYLYKPLTSLQDLLQTVNRVAINA